MPTQRGRNELDGISAQVVFVRVGREIMPVRWNLWILEKWALLPAFLGAGSPYPRS